MSDPFVGQIDLFTYMFVPQGYFPCDGSTYSVQQYQMLYALIANTYGGTVNQTFGVPNLCGLAVAGLGTAPGGTIVWKLASKNGEDTVTLTTNNLPAHAHALDILAAAATDTGPVDGGALAGTHSGDFFCTTPGTQNAQLKAPALSAAYSGPGAHTNRQPYLVLRPCIAWDGIFPSFP